MTYQRGTLSEFNFWHEDVKLSENIAGAGRIGYIKGVPAPENQRTLIYSNAIAHPSGQDDYIWNYGDHPDPQKESISTDQARELGWNI